MLISFPCKDCNKRTLGCHSTCNAYLTARAKQTELNEKERKHKQIIFNPRRRK